MTVLAKQALPAKAGLSEAEALSVVRSDIARPDLTDEEIGAAVHRALLDAGSACSIGELVDDGTDPAVRARVYSVLCLPRPHAPLVMPVRSFCRPRRVGVVSRILMTIRRIVTG
ncbi:hypothetical protein HPQ64_04430 [Rhizobiales bacterium]|uniref:hypothetical protein n=1 Tax=Hongsoonwoonella zoysiae TaxID=2821844 RepID=UPI0015614D83|nr:hypothetical protein [Hongsoonwoonella zoysiae]NRG16928.1 hypothetical protein [Hongsoonwoonella zoysiae]